MSKKSQLVNLYATSFSDSPQYIDNFFTQYYESKNAVTYTEKGLIISALHLLPKNLFFNGRIWRLPFIVGASTLEEYRGKGYFSKLIYKTLDRLNSTNTPFVLLYPSNRELYTKLGFVDVTFCGKKTVKYDGNEAISRPFSYEEISVFFNTYLRNRYQISQYRTLKETQKITERWAVENICAKMYSLNGKSCYVAKSDTEIEEVVGDVDVLNGVKELDGQELTDFNCHDLPYTMARLVSPHKLLKSMKFTRDGEFCFKVKDDFYAPSNVSVNLKIHKNTVILNSSSKYDFVVTGQDLLRLSFGQIIEGCPLSDVINPSQAVFVDKY